MPDSLSLPSSGDRDTRITIEENTSTTRNSAGDVVEHWEPMFRRWAKVEQTAGREMSVAKEQQAEAAYLITLLADTKTLAITPKNRITFRGRTLGISRVTNSANKDRTVEIVALEQVT